MIVAVVVANILTSNLVAKCLSCTFVVVLFSRHNIKKLFSGTLLIVLLLVHSIKLLHTHSYCNFYSAKEFHNSSNKMVSGEGSKLSPDCEICSYQITKDTDNSFYLDDHICKIDRTDFYTCSVAAGSHHLCFSIENRGPPVL